jgi:MOSC domain-containing protein YiiM
MRLVAISVGRTREVQWGGRSVRTAIFKTPVSGRVHVARGNIQGDEQSDLSVHGGPEKRCTRSSGKADRTAPKLAFDFQLTGLRSLR